MKQRVSRWVKIPELRWLAFASLVAVSLGYLIRPTLVISPGSGLLGALTVHNFHDAEGAYRWTRARSSLVFPDPGPGLKARVETHVSGFRHPGQDPPLLVIQAEGESLQTRPGSRPETISFAAETRGWWRSDLEIVFRSETFTPGEGDRRSLGVRVHEVRLVPTGSFIQLGLAPLRQLVFTSAGLLLIFTLLVQSGRTHRRAFHIGMGVAAAWAVGFAFARPYAALLAPATFWILVLAAAFRFVFPSATCTLLEILVESFRSTIRGLKLWRGWPVAALALLSLAGGTASYLARSSLEVDLGSGRETTRAHRFAGFDQEEGVTFRRALQGAEIDLRDFGGGSEWTVEITASLPPSPSGLRRGPPEEVDVPRSLILARAGGKELTAELGPSWSRHSFVAYAPLSWRSGLRLQLPSSSAPLGLRIDGVRIKRGRSFASPRILFALFGASLFFMGACGAAGLSARAAATVTVLLLVGELFALTIDPVLVIPFVPIFLVVTFAGLVFASLVTAALGVLNRHGWLPVLGPSAIAAAMAGFVAWSTATLFPLYEGGHFVYHSSIAEEIWQGRFMHYYLPSPENMLSHQPHWGDAVIPHSCLYHTLVSPLATFPRAWFYSLEKGVLASMLALIALAASALATRFGSIRAGVLAGVIAVSLPPTFQLLGLGHLMTLFGMWAATMALTLITLRFDHLQERATWWWATVALTICFLSYTASLLFAAAVLTLALPLLYRQAPGPTRALAGVTLTATAAAFILYYIHWTWPFLSESLPQLFSGSTSQAGGPSIWNRAVNLPGRLSFTYENALLPLVGLLGLGLVARSPERTVLFLWGGILILFSGFDLFFNFLLKHHYFVMAPVSVGLGLGAAWLSGKGRIGVAAVAVFLVYLLVMAGRAALDVALGNA